MIKATRLSKSFSTKTFFGTKLKETIALSDFSFSFESGINYAIVGESGSGKSTLAKMIVRLIEPSAGTIQLNQNDISLMKKGQEKQFRRTVQIIFQNPSTSLNPRLRIKTILHEACALIASKENPRDMIKRVMRQVDLGDVPLDRFPHQLSGGQKQRVAIARALLVQPDYLILDEPFSSLDVIVQKQIMDLLKKLSRERHITLILISHDLQVARYISDQILVLQQGKLIEHQSTKDLFEKPQDPYTKKLLSSILA